MLIDVHCHLDDERFDSDLPEVIARSRVSVIIANGINPASNRKVLGISRRFPSVKPALGLFPLDALNCDVEAELEFIRSQRPFAIGEVGLDYSSDSDRERQKEIFSMAISLAKELDKPLIVHSRKAEADVIGMLEDSKANKVVMHCFGGSQKLLKRILDAGWYLSIPTSIYYDEHFQRIVARAPITQLLTETDAPLLGPVRGERNEPANISKGVRKIAEIKGMTFEDTENSIFMNYQRLFI